jgi:adenylate cyclase
MAIEIERKFLVKGDFRTQSSKKIQIIQGFISSVPERTVRIRLIGEVGFITIKGEPSNTGKSRYEWEKKTTH